MKKNQKIIAPFFEIGPKNYMYGDRILDLALAADEASEKYDVHIIFTAPYADIRRVNEATRNIHVFAPHVDPLPIGRGLADVLPESVKAAGAQGVMLNHAERPLSYSLLEKTVQRAKKIGLYTIICADSITEVKAVAHLKPDIIVAEPAELIGTGERANFDYVVDACKAVQSVNPDVMVLIGAGISSGRDVYDAITHGSDAAGTSSGVACADDPLAMIDEMVHAARKAWDDREEIKLGQ